MSAQRPKVTVIPINALGGNMTNITLTIMASKAVIVEDPTQNGGVPQGLTGYYIDTQPPQPAIPIMPVGTAPPQATPQNLQAWLPNSAGQQGPQYEPITLGGVDARIHGAFGEYVGAQGTVVLQLTSSTQNATNILL